MIRLGAPFVIAKFKSNCLKELTNVRNIHTVNVFAIIGIFILKSVVIADAPSTPAASSTSLGTV